VTEVELDSLPESTQLADIASFLQQQQVEKLQLTGCKNSSKANQLLRTLIDHCEQFPALVEIAGPQQGRVPEAWILKGWFPCIQGNSIKISRNPVEVTLSTQVADTLTNPALLNLLTCPHLQWIDLTGQAVSEAFARKLLNQSLKKLIVSPKVDEKIFFVKMLCEIEPGIVFKKHWSLKNVNNFLQINPLQGRQLILTDDDILAMVERFPSLEYLDLESADLSQITAAGIRVLLKLKLYAVTLGLSSLQLINELLSLNTLTSLNLHTEKLPVLDFAQFFCRASSKVNRNIIVRVTKFHSLCLLLLQHPAVDYINFMDTAEPSAKEKNAMVELGFGLKKHYISGFESYRKNPRSHEQRSIVFNGRHFSLTVRDTLVCSNKDLNDQGLLLLPRTKSLTLKNAPAVTFNGFIAYLQNAPLLQTFQIYRTISSEEVSQLKSLGWKMTAKNRMYQEFERINFK
jgi:hypothetical protein